MDAGQRRRRIDRVTAEDFLSGLEARSPAEVRQMRDECREEEARLSYTRRLVQGRIDIAEAELERRERGDTEPLDLVRLLPQILADEQPSRRDAHVAPLYAPAGPVGQRPHDALLEDPALARIPEMDDDELRALLARLRSEEREVSSMRRRILDHYDRLQVELIERYRQGQADVDDVVSAVAAEAGTAEPGGE